ncbi:MAG TPA: DUF1080 domain-containing protein, partial [Flavitalea sp.]|nr:DUF1080 domain-containing protein [Flavitalea sp.]
MKYYLPVAFFFITITSIAQQESLFNKRDLTGWDTYIGPELNDSGVAISIIPVGLNKDPLNVFSVTEVDSEKVIRISGESWGGISTVKEYSNYHLRLKYKWGRLKWGQKKNKPRDSGLLYHAVGAHGADYGAWMRSQEFQIEEGNTGDYWGVAGGVQDIPAFLINGRYVYDPSVEVVTFSATSAAGRHCVKTGTYEINEGWNTIDLYCFKDTSVHVVNGNTVMVLYNSRQQDGDRFTPLIEGKIQIQSEGAEVFYKDIFIEGIRG